MTVRVLVVDDSAFYRRRVIEALNAQDDIEVVGEAGNGLEALEKMRRLEPDVITMDISMPVMDGVAAVRRIMSERPTPVLMFSSLTTEGARETFDALDAGALDFLPKEMEAMRRDRHRALDQLCRKVRALGAARPEWRRSPEATGRTPAVSASGAGLGWARVVRSATAKRPRSGATRLVLIGTSTGGPAALQKVLSRLPEGYPLPVVVVQHMPGPFTQAFAERMDKLCRCAVREARDGDRLSPGTVLIAPGGKQTLLRRRRDAVEVEVVDSSASDIYKPSVDVTFLSAAESMPGGVLGVILTGMGADGREGARKLKAGNSQVWAQDQRSSLIFGMPKAVIDAGHADRIMSINRIGAELAELR